MTDWRKAHETHVEVAKSIATPRGQEIVARGLWRFVGGGGNDDTAPNGLDHTLDDYREFAALLPEFIAYADTYWVSSDMGALSMKAAETMPGDVMLRAEDFLSKEGFLLLQTPIAIGHQPDGSELFTVKAISWTNRNPEMGILFVGWTTHEALGATLIEQGRATEDTLDWVKHHEGSTGDPRVWFPVTSAIWSSGQTFDEVFGPDPESGEYERWFFGMAGDVARHLYSAVVLMGNRVARQERQHLSRAQARRAQRAGFPMQDVVCITLRRELVGTESELAETSTEGKVNWSHRWMVSGHWANQWYPSLGVHRRIYIAPYIKGPEDKPLVIKDRVYSWTR